MQYERLAAACEGVPMRTVALESAQATPSQCQRLCDATLHCAAVTSDMQSASCALFTQCDAPAVASGSRWPISGPVSFRVDSASATFERAVALQEPLIHSAFTADPAARVFDGSLYVIMSHDTDERQQWPGVDADQFQMVDYRLLRTPHPDAPVEDLGSPLSLQHVQWASGQLWAPDLIRGKDGRYHLLFAAKDRDGSFRLGVAHASQPDGPFVADEAPLPGCTSIDPSAFIDELAGGQALVYFGGLRGGQLERWSAERAEGSARGPLVARLDSRWRQVLGAVAEVMIIDERSGQPLRDDDEERRFFEGVQVASPHPHPHPHPNPNPYPRRDASAC